MQTALTELIDTVEKMDVAYDAQSLADALWLAQFMEVGESKQVNDVWQKVESNEEVQREEKIVPPLTKQPETTHGKRVTIEINDQTYVGAQVQPAKAQQGSLSVGISQEKERLVEGKLFNALRHFRKKRYTPRHKRLDITKTVDFIADTNLFVPHFKAARDKRYALVIITEVNEIMNLYQEERDQLTHAMHYFNLFYDVKHYYLHPDKKKLLSFDKQGRKRATKVTIQEETLIMIMSDMVTSIWRDGTMYDQLKIWQKKATTFAVQVFPRHLWRRTALVDADDTLLYGARNNGLMRSSVDEWLSEAEQKEGVKLPLATFELPLLEAVAKVVTADKRRRSKGAIFYPSLTLSNDHQPTAKDRVLAFYENSTKEAQELAAYLSVVPLELNVMKMVQQVMMNDPTKRALAEVMSGGLIYEGETFYHFYGEQEEESVRQLLSRRLGVEAYVKTFMKLSHYVETHLGATASFRAVLQGKSNEPVQPLNALEREFARINIERLRRLGGYFEKIAEQLTLRIEAIIPHSKRFLMGSEDGYSNEKPVHEVVINDDFEIAKTPVTFAEYDIFCDVTNHDKPDDEGWGRGKRPVINVSWHDAMEYCKWLSEVTGDTYRLPTEAEWEFSARAGTTTRWSFGDSEKKLKRYAWYTKNSDSQTYPVGEKWSNGWGLYDMHGNVWEWCMDDWQDDYSSHTNSSEPFISENKERKILRGGSWYSLGVNTRSAYRGRYVPTYSGSDVGFRLLRTLPS
jgi:hypothetical protein